MNIATFNCNSIRSRLDIVIPWLESNRPDILALQETKVEDGTFPVQDFERTGWHVRFRGEKRYNGVAMVTAAPLEEISFGLDDGDDGESETRLALARRGDLFILNTYVPQGTAFDSDKYAFKREWLARLKHYLLNRFDPKSDRLVWVGDLNIAPLPRDVHDHKRIWPHVCHCDDMTNMYDGFISWGLVDIFRKHLPDEGIFTFWDYRVRDSVGRNMGWRIDHVLATRAVADKSVSCSVDKTARTLPKPSDHTFVSVEIG